MFPPRKSGAGMRCLPPMRGPRRASSASSGRPAWPIRTCRSRLMVHVGTASVPARLRPFGADHARLVLDRPCRSSSATGWCYATRGAARSWAEHASSTPTPGVAAARRWRPLGGAACRHGRRREMCSAKSQRRGAVEMTHLRRLGLLPGRNTTREAPDGVKVIDGWWVHAPVLDGMAAAAAHCSPGAA